MSKNGHQFIVDEFYKASSSIPDDRYASLVKIIIEIKKIAKQCYFIAPDVTFNPDEYSLTRGMQFLRKDDKYTVYTEISEDYKEIENHKNKDALKERKLLELLNNKEKCLIYAGDPKKIKTVSEILNNNLRNINCNKLNSFSSYLSKNYGNNYKLSDLVLRGVGIHDGKIHRPLAQLQIKLFSEDDGIDVIISSSSIIEGVNTSAKNVILWSNTIANKKLSPNSYNNILGRAGRMFRYFVGNVFLLAKPPEVKKPQNLSLEYTEEVMSSVEDYDRERELTPEQIAKLKSKEVEFDKRWVKGLYRKLRSSMKLSLFNMEHIEAIVSEITKERDKWNDERLKRFLNEDPSKWSYKIAQSVAALAKIPSPENALKMIQAFSYNWALGIPQIIEKMPSRYRNVESYFEFERKIAYKFPNTLALCVKIYNVFYEKNIDISGCLVRISNAFLPKIVYQLEEYGLPRFLSKKIVNAQLIKLDDPEMTLSEAIRAFKNIGEERLYNTIPDRHEFERYIIKHFYSGI